MPFHKLETVISGSRQRKISIDATYPSDTPNAPVVVFAHGFKGFKDWGIWNLLAEAFAAEGFAFVKFNFSYNGVKPEQLTDFVDLEAFGQNNYSIEMDDLGLVLDWVSAPNDRWDGSQLSLIGHSRGGGLAILKAKEDARVKKLITWASVADLGWYFTPENVATMQANGVIYSPNQRTGQQMPLYLQFYEDYIAQIERFDVLHAASRMPSAWLIIHGEEDPAVPVTAAYKLLDASGDWAELALIKGADHVFGASHPYLSDTLPEHAEDLFKKSIYFLKT